MNSVMSGDRSMLAQLLESGREGYAAVAAHQLAAEHPEAADALAGGGHRGWHGFLSARLAELAVAVVTNTPELLAEQIRWCEAAFGARGVPVSAMRRAMTVLRTVLAEELPPAVQAEADAMFGAALDALADGAPPAVLSPDLPPLAAEYLIALADGDRRKAWKVGIDAASNGTPVPEIYAQLVVPVLREVGARWEADELSIAEEHFVSTTTQQLLPQLYPHATYREPHGKVALAAAIGGNNHDLALRILADLLELDGWRVVLLGADFPEGELADAAERFDADVVALSIALVTQVDKLIATAAMVRELERKPKLIVGGGALAGHADLAQRLGANATSESVLDVPDLARALVGLPA